MKEFSRLVIFLAICFSLLIYFTKSYKHEKYLLHTHKDTTEREYFINPNVANAREFENLPGIGPSLAARIIEDRQNNGRFNKIEELKRVAGIGDTKFNGFEQYLSLEVY